MPAFDIPLSPHDNSKMFEVSSKYRKKRLHPLIIFLEILFIDDNLHELSVTIIKEDFFITT